MNKTSLTEIKSIKEICDLYYEYAAKTYEECRHLVKTDNGKVMKLTDMLMSLVEDINFFLLSMASGIDEDNNNNELTNHILLKYRDLHNLFAEVQSMVKSN